MGRLYQSHIFPHARDSFLRSEQSPQWAGYIRVTSFLTLGIHYWEASSHHSGPAISESHLSSRSGFILEKQAVTTVGRLYQSHIFPHARDSFLRSEQSPQWAGYIRVTSFLTLGIHSWEASSHHSGPAISESHLSSRSGFILEKRAVTTVGRLYQSHIFPHARDSFLRSEQSPQWAGYIRVTSFLTLGIHCLSLPLSLCWKPKKGREWPFGHVPIVPLRKQTVWNNRGLHYTKMLLLPSDKNKINKGCCGKSTLSLRSNKTLTCLGDMKQCGITK